MRFYLASSFKRKSQCQTIKAVLESYGHTIPDIWWNVDGKERGPADNREWHAEPFVQAIAQRHWKTIRECDALILVSSEFEETSFNGANIELGYALGKGIPCFSIGIIPRSGMYSGVIQCRNIDELLEAINIFSLKGR